MTFIKRAIQLFLKRGFWISGPQLLSIVVQLVALPVVLRALPADMYGGFQFSLAVFTWMTLFSVGHMTLGASRGIATDKQGTFLYSFLYRIRIIIPLAFLLVIASYVLDSDRGVFQQLLFLAAGYLAIGYLPQASFAEFLIARQEFKKFFAWVSAVYVLSPIVSALAAVHTGNVLVYTAVQFGTISAISIAGFLYVLFRYRVIASYRKGEIDRSVLKYGFSLMPAEIVSGTSNQLTSFIIGPFFGFANLAMYSVASRIDSAIKNFLASVYSIMYADFARMHYEDLREILRKKILNIFLLSLGLSAVIAIPGFLYIRFAIPESYGFAVYVYAVLILGFPAILLEKIMHTFLAAHLRHRALVFSNVVPSIIKIALVLALGFTFGILGVAMAVAAMSWISYAFYYASIFRKEMLLRFVPKSFRNNAFDKPDEEKQSNI